LVYFGYRTELMPGVLGALLGSYGNPFVVQYLVVAGGGGGGSSGANYGGGGGAGGYRSSVLGELTGGGGSPEETFNITLDTEYSVSVGAGGSAGANGIDSSIFGITSTGGGAGRGNAYASQGFSGGSGGGGTPINGLGGVRSTTPIQGHRGGVASSAGQGDVNSASGGGGGAGSEGLDLTAPGFFRNSPGAGGDGLQSSITGTPTFYAAGGVGSSYYSGERTNDIGGGAQGAVVGPFISNVGTINTGSGGGGGVYGAGGPGGSGVVIIRYPNVLPNMIIGSGLVIDDGSNGNISGSGTRLSPSFTPSGFKVYRFKSGAGNVSW
jgi:hypothetical protein